MTDTPREAARQLSRPILDRGFKPVALHTYTDTEGNPLYWRIRAKHPDTGDKWIRPMRLNGQGYELAEPKFPNGKPLYALHRIASNPAAVVWIFEGEQKADALNKLGLVATTSGSATSANAADWQPLRGRTVRLWPDNDDPGKACAGEVASILLGMGCAVFCIDVDKLGLGIGEDVMQWLAAHPEAAGGDVETLPVLTPSPAEKSAPDGAEAARAWPESLDEAAYCGLAGEIVRTIEPQTESDPSAILLQVLVAFGALVGRGPHFPIEGDQHHPNLFALIVGETSKARKGTSWGRVREIFSRAAEWPNVVDGLSSGEGLKWAVRDRMTKIEHDAKGFTNEVETDPGVADKRLLVVEAEFAQVLRQAARTGNTLSATIRGAWDSGNLRTLTKHDPITATGAHICIIGHITADELRAELTATDSANGFANRFIFNVAKRSKALAFGGKPLAPEIVADFARRIAAAAGKARNVGAVGMTDSASNAWRAVYERLSDGYPGLYGAVTGRAEAQCLRLALAYALMCGATEIDREHLLAALAVWERAAVSARFIFGDAIGDPVADQVLDALRAARPDGITRTGISNLLGRHQAAERIGAALALLERRGLARRESVQTGGAPAERWTAA